MPAAFKLLNLNAGVPSVCNASSCQTAVLHPKIQLRSTCYAINSIKLQLILRKITFLIMFLTILHTL